MFKKIFLDLLAENNLNQSQFSKKTSIPYTTINGWIARERLPDFNALIKLAKFFDVSIDYLCGRTDDMDSKDYYFPEKSLSSESEELLSIFDTLSPAAQAQVIGFAAAMQEKYQIKKV